jgi:hypothetical protein
MYQATDEDRHKENKMSNRQNVDPIEWFLLGCIFAGVVHLGICML